MNDGGNDGGLERDPLALAVRALKASTPPDDPRAAREQALAAFDARSHKSRAWWRIGLAAATLLLACGTLWQVASRELAATRQLAALTAQFASIDARLTTFAQQRATESAATPPRLVIETADPTARAEIEAVLEITGSDPGYLRLLTAKRYEAANTESAIERYRDLIEDYAESPAASVARVRLAELAK